MPVSVSGEVVDLLTYLLPGFVAAWVFYGLTSHPRPSQFERTIQALILSFVVNALSSLVHVLLDWLGRVVIAIRPWDETATLASNLLLALGMGIVLAYVTNNDSVHKRLRKLGLTSRTSHASEWYYVLATTPRFVVLQLADGRRLYGWPKEWPIERERGQFYIQIPSWIDKQGHQIDLPQLEGILVDAKDVARVELLHDNSGSSHDQPSPGLQPPSADAAAPS